MMHLCRKQLQRQRDRIEGMLRMCTLMQQFQSILVKILLCVVNLNLFDIGVLVFVKEVD